MPREKLLIETFRFEDDDDYERDLFASFQEKRHPGNLRCAFFKSENVARIFLLKEVKPSSPPSLPCFPHYDISAKTLSIE